MGDRPWTPGPWKFGRECVDPEWAIVVADRGTLLANVNADNRQDGNTRLIASAPTLYAALNALLTACVQRLSEQDRDAIKAEMHAASAVLFDAEHGDKGGE